MATHSSVLALRILGTREPGELPCIGLHRVRHNWIDLASVAAAVTKYIMHIHRCTCVPHSEPLLSPSPSHPSGSSQCTGFECPVSCIELGLVICFTYGNIHVSMLFAQVIPPSPSPTESKSLFFISVSLLLSCIDGHYYHLSKVHIYALVYCIGVLLSDLLRSV